jgi:long-chain acyl-CoA synthetase
VLHGGEPCPPSLKRTMIDWWGPVFVEYFGFTEGGMTVATTEEWLARPGTVGRAMPYQEVRIIGEDGAVRGPRQEGRVYFANHGTTRPFVYLGDASKTEDSYVDGAYTAGDLGWLDEDGYLYLSGRSADVIVTGGVNVYPAEIEAVLAGVDGVDDVCVVAVPDEARGENVAAVVVPAVGADANAVTDAVRAAAEAELAGYKRPRAVIVRAALPRDATGKLLRRTLRDELWRDGDDRFVSPPAP